MNGYFRCFIGSYSVPSEWAGAPNAHGEGISVIEVAKTGSMRLVSTSAEINPSFLVIDSQASALYAVTEPERAGDLLAYRVGPDGGVVLTRRTATGADAPCHVSVANRRGIAIVSHYHGAHLSLIDTDPASPRPTQLVALPTRLGNQDRGLAVSRPHSTLFVGDDLLVAADTGRDGIALYRIGSSASGWALKLVSSLALPIGVGPRHLTQHRESGVIYSSNQNAGSISAIRIAKNGRALQHVTTVATPTLGRARAFPSEIAVHAEFDVLYVGNRGDNSVAMLQLDASGLDMKPIGAVDILGRNPRHFGLSPDSSLLLVANQDSDDITSFAVSDSGRNLEWTGGRLKISTPTAICFG